MMTTKKCEGLLLLLVSATTALCVWTPHQQTEGKPELLPLLAISRPESTHHEPIPWESTKRMETNPKVIDPLRNGVIHTLKTVPAPQSTGVLWAAILILLSYGSFQKSRTNNPSQATGLLLLTAALLATATPKEAKQERTITLTIPTPPEETKPYRKLFQTSLLKSQAGDAICTKLRNLGFQARYKSASGWENSGETLTIVTDAPKHTFEKTARDTNNEFKKIYPE